MARRTRLGRTTALCSIVIAVSSVLSVFAPAAHAATTTTTQDPNAAPALLAGITVTGAVVKTPNEPVRKLDARHATAFMQSWLPDSVYQHLPPARPPKELPVSNLEVETNWNGAPERMIVYYAADGKNAWVGMPRQNFGWAVVTEEKWILAAQSPRLIKAFAGKLEPVGQAGTPPTAPSTTTTTAAANHKSSSGSGFPWLPVGIGAVVIVMLFGLARARTMRAARAASTADGS